MAEMPATIGIIGIGLIGGSIGLAVKRRMPQVRVIGYSSRKLTLQSAVQLNAIDEAIGTIEELVIRSELIIVCTPISVMPTIFEQMQRHVRGSTVVTDVGSTKASIVKLGDAIFSGKCSFVGGHPMAGSEKTGVAAASSDLFQKRTFVITPTSKTRDRATSVVTEFWRRLGMDVVSLDPADHDKRVALVSHLPHVIAAATAKIQTPESLRIHGTGFLDVTRVAAGDAKLWADILADNRVELATALENIEAALLQLRTAIRQNDHSAIHEWLDDAKRTRTSLQSSRLKGAIPQYWVVQFKTGLAFEKLRARDSGQQWLFDSTLSGDQVTGVTNAPIEQRLLDRLAARPLERHGISVQVAQSTKDSLLLLARSEHASNVPYMKEQVQKLIREQLRGLESVDIPDDRILFTVLKDPDVVTFEKLEDTSASPLKAVWSAFLGELANSTIAAPVVTNGGIKQALEQLWRSINNVKSLFFRKLFS